MADTTFSNGTVIEPAWAQDVNDLTYGIGSTTLPSDGAGMVGYKLPYVGAVPSTVSLKLHESVSSKDFGAVCDCTLAGVGTDDTAAIQKALDYCATNGAELRQVGLSKITSPLVWPTTQITIRGTGAVRTYDSGFVYTGSGTMVTGQTANKVLAFTNLYNLVFKGPGAGVNCFYGDFYEGGAEGCIFTGWDTAVTCFGTLNTFRHNRFASVVNGIVVTNWPAGSAQAGVSTTTFLSERNSYAACTGWGLRLDTSGTGGGNIVSSSSVHDVFEQNGNGLYVDKSYDFLLKCPHFEFHTTWAYQFINSRPQIIRPYIHPGDAAKLSMTNPGAAANSAGHTRIDYDGVRSMQLTLSTLGANDVGFRADDSGKLVPFGAGLVGTWTPNLSSSGGVSSGNTYSVREGNYTRIGNMCIATFRVVMLTKDAGMTGNLMITGLPFVADGGVSNVYGNIIRMLGVTFSGGAFSTLVADISGQDAFLVKIGSALTPTNLGPAEISGTAQFSGAIIYLTA